MKTRKSQLSLSLLGRIGLILALILPIYVFLSQSPPAYAVADCSVDYNIVNQWGNGFQADVTVTNNTGTAVQGWNLTWTFGSGQSFGSGWNATFSPSGSAMSAANVASHWNGTIGANGGTVAFGIIVNHSGNVSVPTDFAVNGVSCIDDGSPTNTPVPPTATSVPPTNTSVPPTSTSAPPTSTSAPPTSTTVPPTNTAVPPTATTVPGSGACAVAYNIVNQWGNGFQVDVIVTNNSSTAVNGWSLVWTFAGNEAYGAGWNATMTASGNTVTASNPTGHWNGTIGANGGTVSFGFQGTHSGNVVVPSPFTLNGTTCGGGTPLPTATATVPGPTATATVPGPTATATVPGPTPTATVPGPTPTAPPPGTHVANPFVGADFYLNPDYAASVMEQANATGGSLGTQMAQVANIPTALWMDRIGAITDGRGLQGHLDEALLQQNGSTPMTIIVVIYDLPNRDCAALASNGELLIAEDGLNRYKTEYIDPIVDIMNNPQYSSLRIVTVIEPDSLPNLVTNLSTPECAEANSTGAYVQGIQYAVEQIHTMANAYIYLDIGHSGWLGWDSNFGPTVNLYVNAIQGTADGFNSIDGFITNTANYTSLEEPFLPDPNLTIGNPIRGSNFYEWNPYFDELDFATALRTAFINAGFPSSIGMLIDTSRNGWGGDARPTAVSTSTDLNTYVDESRIDQRPHRGGWCNQAGAGIGERPQANPAPGIDAFVWVKPPGESDGISDPNFEPDPNDPGV
jgi:cellulose 1,4-beta-cellobiosidase